MTWKNVNAEISIHATTMATRAADRCLNATRAPAMRTARKRERCCGLANVSSTPAELDPQVVEDGEIQGSGARSGRRSGRAAVGRGALRACPSVSWCELA